MPRIRFTLPEVKQKPDARPSSCPRCGGVTFHKHGQVEKAIKDLYISRVTVVRYRCVDCGRTFRRYPEGVDRHIQSKRLRALSALSWALGLSHRSVSNLLTALGSALSRMSSWRDVQEAGVGAMRALSGGLRARVEVVGADETVVKLKGEKAVVGFVMDAERGRLLGIDLLVERDRAGFTEWLSGYVDKFGVKAIVSDDLNTYKPVVEELGLEHQICLAHVRKNVRRRLKEIEGWDWHKARIWLLLRELPDDGGRELMRMERNVREDAELRRLVVKLSDKWRSLTRHKSARGLPETNNCTERVIGRSKIRYKTVRGYKSIEGMMNGLRLTQWVWSGEDGLSVGELVNA